MSSIAAAALSVLLALDQSKSQAFVGQWTCEYFGVYREERLVAGAGFEPATFGL